MRVELAGAGIVIVAGMMLGGALHPNLAGDDRPLGPQMLLGGSATRSDHVGDPALSMASYRATLPAYVVGTDATRPLALPQTRGASEVRPRDRAEYDAPVGITHTAYADPEPQPARYPSEWGEAPRRAVAASDAGIDTDDAADDDPG